MTTGTASPNLGYWATYAALVALYPASAVPAGASAETGDFGPLWADRTNWNVLGGGSANKSTFYPLALTSAGITAAATQCNAAGGGVVQLPPGTISITAALPLLAGVIYRGAGYTVNAGGGSLLGGTILSASGSIDCFDGNNVDLGSVQANQSTLLSTQIPYCGVQDLGIAGFVYGIKCGALYEAGPIYGIFKNLYIQTCTSWGMWIENYEHCTFENISVYANNHGGMFMNSGTALYNFGNSQFRKLTGGNNTANGSGRTWAFQSRAGSTTNNLSIYDIGGTGISVSSTQACTMAAPIATTITNTSASIAATNTFAAGDPVGFSAAVGTGGSGVATGTTYYVSATGLSGSAFQVSTTVGGSVITFNASGTPNVLTAKFGVTDLSKFGVGMPVNFASTANGFTSTQIYFVTSVSGTSGSGSITVANYMGGAGTNGSVPIPVTGSTAMNIVTKAWPVLEIGGADAGSVVTYTSISSAADLEVGGTAHVVLQGLTGLDAQWGTIHAPSSTCDLCLRNCVWQGISMNFQQIGNVTDFDSTGQYVTCTGALAGQFSPDGRSLYAKGYGVSTSNTDNGPALNNFFADVVAYNCKGILPNGALAVKTPLVIQAAGAVLSGPIAGVSVTLEGAGGSGAFSDQGSSCAGTLIYWAGPAPISAQFLGYIGAAGNTLTVTSMTSGSIAVGQALSSSGANFLPCTSIYSQTSGTPGGAGVYLVEQYYPSAVGSSGSPATFYAYTPLVSVLGVSKLVLRDMAFNSANLAGDAMYLNSNSFGLGQFGYVFENVYWSNPAAFNSCFRIAGSVDLARFIFSSCNFQPSVNCVGFAVGGNGNSLDHAFVGCQFEGLGQYNMYLNGGAVTCIECEFNGATIADVRLDGGCSRFNMIGGWAQGSNRFIYGTPMLCAISIKDSVIDAYPWANYYCYGVGAPPTINSQAFCPIYLGTVSTLVLDNVSFPDPLNGGGIANWPSTYKINVQNFDYNAGGAPVPFRWINLGTTGGTGQGTSASGAVADVVFLDASGTKLPAVAWTGPTATAAPSAGGASALPATPKGYYQVMINGVSQQVAYY